LAAFIIVCTSIPTIVNVANIKKLFDEPGLRKAHDRNVPTLGGIAIFAALLITIGVFADFSKQHEFQYLYMSSIILFFVGLKDDILIIAPFKKLWGQLLATVVIIILGDVRFTSLHGFLGINHIPYLASSLLTFFVFIVIINGFNLIDGIDGLATGVGVIASLIFGTWFYLVGDYEYTVIAATMAGSLIAFFWFNVYSIKYKIFMGDTGSLLVGLFMAVMAVRFNELNIVPSNNWFIHAAPAVSFAILIVPLFDTIRVFVIRIFQGKSPFKADTNHVHHRLLAMGMSHIRATKYILGANAIIVAISLYVNRLGIIRLMLLNLILATIFSLLPEIIYFIKEKFKQSNS
jgi:UDP-N-acetylmuramyl pentapeptide phosphotransferase/UDP-N-acetylglucosamine-1-phosphate transferase